MVDTVDRGELISKHPNIEVRYTPDALFARLTDNNIPHSVELGHNFLEIRRHNHDPLVRLEAHVKSDYPPSARKSKEPGPLMSTFKAVMEIRTTKDSLKAQDFAPYFKKAGLNLEYKEEITPDSAGKEQKYYVSKETEKDHPVRIRLFNVSYGIYTMIINVPSHDQPLTNLEEFAGDQEVFFETLEKSLKAVYEMEEGKNLPQEPLTFRENEKNTPLAVKCTHCGSMYNGIQSFECPNCGVSQPETEDDKIKYYN